jgi:hypothetical protein
VKEGFYNDGLPQPNPPLTRTTLGKWDSPSRQVVIQPMWYLTQVCSDASSTERQSLRPLRHSGKNNEKWIEGSYQHDMGSQSLSTCHQTLVPQRWGRAFLHLVTRHTHKRQTAWSIQSLFHTDMACSNKTDRDICSVMAIPADTRFNRQVNLPDTDR